MTSPENIRSRQDRIWDHYQNEGIANFDDAVPRLRFLFRRARRGMTVPNPRILNIGIGNGWLERRCLEAGWRVEALDPNERAVETLRQAGVAARTGRITALPQEPKSLDVVFCSEVLEHLDDDELEKGLAEIGRTLKPGGRLIGTVPYREDLSAGMVVCPECGIRFHRWGHRQSFDRGKIEQLFDDAGLVICRLGPRAFADYAVPSLPAITKHLLRMPLARLGSQLIYANLYFEATHQPSKLPG